MIDVDISLTVSDRTRRFDLSARFSTEAGFAALYGPSGSGKSLTLQAIAGLLQPAKGFIRIGGATLFDSESGIDLAPPARRIGYLFQNYALFPHLSVEDNVGFGLTSWRQGLSTEGRERVQALLVRFGLDHLARSRPATLSGGQQQRVALARALACEPDILLLDEPFAALNPLLRGELREELAQVQRQWDIPVLMITHDIEDVLHLAQVTFVYEHGQIVREIDMLNGTEQAHVREQLGAPAVAEDSDPLRRTLRRLLQFGRQA